MKQNVISYVMLASRLSYSIFCERPLQGINADYVDLQIIGLMYVGL